MYDINWARSVYAKFTVFCTRAEQINNCIRATALESPYQLDNKEIQNALIQSIRSKGEKGVLWRKYKRLCKVKPLNKELLCQVTALMQDSFWKFIRDLA